MTELVAVDDLAAALNDDSWDAVVLVTSSREASGHEALDAPIAKLDHWCKGNSQIAKMLQ